MGSLRHSCNASVMGSRAGQTPGLPHLVEDIRMQASFLPFTRFPHCSLESSPLPGSGIPLTSFKLEMRPEAELDRP